MKKSSLETGKPGRLGVGTVPAQSIILVLNKIKVPPKILQQYSCILRKPNRCLKRKLKRCDNITYFVVFTLLCYFKSKGTNSYEFFLSRKALNFSGIDCFIVCFCVCRCVHNCTCLIVLVNMRVNVH